MLNHIPEPRLLKFAAMGPPEVPQLQQIELCELTMLLKTVVIEIMKEN